MFLARVIGSVVSTHKNERLVGKRLLLVKKLTLEMVPEGQETIALDVVDAGMGDNVLVVQEGSSARRSSTISGSPCRRSLSGCWTGSI